VADSSLAGAVEEVGELRNIYGAGRTRVMEGAEVREAAVKRAAAEYDIVHLATHAVLDSRRPM